MNFIEKFNNSEKYTKYSILIIILFSIIVLSLTSIYHVAGDACWHLSIGRYIGLNFKIPLYEQFGRDEPFWAPPLYHFVVATVFFIFSLFNSNAANIAIKFISPLFGILTLIFSFLIIKKLFNSKIAYYSMLFLTFLPIFLDYSIFSYVESMLLFFIILSIYFAINNKIIFASIAAGFGILTKYNGLFILPLLIYIVYRNNKGKKNLIASVLIITVLPLILSMPWFIRNYIILGNPIWPFLNFIFNGVDTKTPFHVSDLSRLIDINIIIFTYLGLFGVPNGSPENLFFFKIPLLNLLITIWLIGTFIFTLPFIYFKKIKKKDLIIVWVVPYIILFILYLVDANFSVIRIILPVIPALAIVWAHGFDRLLNPKYKKIIIVLFTLVVLGLISSEFIKIKLATNEWNKYNIDFQWVKKNTKKEAVILANWQCSYYNLERLIVNPVNESIIYQADYIWVNQKMSLDFEIKPQMLTVIENKEFPIAYENKNTGTIIYKVTRTTNP